MKFSHAILIDIDYYQLQCKSKLSGWKPVLKEDFTVTHDGGKIFVEINKSELDKDTKYSFRLLVLEKNGNITNFNFKLK